MDGADEGAYAWLAVNFLLRRVGKPAADTVSTIDLGGGSTQIAYAANASPQTTPLQVFGETYNIFTHSYLGFGLNSARAVAGGLCMLSPTTSQISCRIAVQAFVDSGFLKVNLQPDLSGESHKLPVFVLSYIYDVAEELGLLQQPRQRDEPVFISLMDFQTLATKILSLIHISEPTRPY
eukprot:TRINITY_DN30748_c0_g1_i1.p1 TRINITY_DN30748_c0_g1~~TRINITY_DN30748_c0_g1_i1.p1  ORF type:complete len:179 (+),score=30.53 TRINITY_DN30748_c0_g1_i1:202-738(+)